MDLTTWTPSTYTTGFTNLGSLSPTSFPSDCLQSLWDFQTSPLQGDTFIYQTQGCAISSCCPSGKFYTESWAWMTSYFSPGVCPSQYRSCSPPPATAPTVLSSQPGETIVFCCPTNYACPYTIPTYGEPYFLFCQSLMTVSTTIVVVMDNIFDQSTVTVSTRSWTLPTMEFGQYQLAYPIQVRMGASSATRTSSVGSSQAGSTTTSNAKTNTSNSTVPSNSQSSLTAGAIAGIVIGAFFGGMLIIAGIVLLIYRRKSRNKQPPAAAQTDGGGAWIAGYKAELDGRRVTSMAQPTHSPSEGWHLAELPPHSLDE